MCVAGFSNTFPESLLKFPILAPLRRPQKRAGTDATKRNTEFLTKEAVREQLQKKTVEHTGSTRLATEICKGTKCQAKSREIDRKLAPKP